MSSATLDAIFDVRNFVNEVIWKRSAAHSDRTQGSKHFGRLHDVLLVYAKSGDHTWHEQYQPLDESYSGSHYTHTEPETGRTYRLDNLTGPGGAAKGNPQYEVMGVTRYWRYSKVRMAQLIEEGRVIQTRPGAVPQYKRYLDESAGRPLQDVWDDIPPLNSQAKERLGWNTQKPLALLERVIATSSNPGDIVLDPFCGCGTALVAAQQLGRLWVGIDITYLAIAVMRERIQDSFPELGPVEVVGRPTEVAGAKALLAKGGLAGQYQFQWWAIDLVGATPQGGIEKKGADKGVDGVITFSGVGGKLETCIVSVKSGLVGAAMIQQLKGAMDTHSAAMAIFVTLEEPTGPMKTEAAVAGFYHSELSGKDYPRIQILTIKELLEDGKRPLLPVLVLPQYQKAQKIGKSIDQQEMFG